MGLDSQKEITHIPIFGPAPDRRPAAAAVADDEPTIIPEAPVAVSDDLPEEIEIFRVVESELRGRFELLRNGVVVAFAETYAQPGLVIVPHVETTPEHRGKGYGALVMEGMLTIIRRDGRKIRPGCSYATQYLRQNPQYADLIG